MTSAEGEGVMSDAMSAELLSMIDWQRPWLAPLQPVAAPILQAADWRLALNAEAVRVGLRNHRELPVQFVPQHCLPADVPYERFISETGCVPTRDNLHDFFNALVWLAYPRIKIRLNALHAAELENAIAAQDAHTPNARAGRGRTRDAATIFDENAALMMTSDAALITALRAHDWRELFLSRRDRFGAACELRLFGHALMEKLVSPYKAITAHVLPLVVDAGFFEMPERDRRKWIDITIAHQLEPGLAMTDFTPLPVLGMPGWWQEQDEAFYADATVFRPRKTRI